MENSIFTEVYKKYYKTLFIYALSLCKNNDIAQDLVHETFIKAFLKWEDIKNPKYWLTVVLKNEYLKYTSRNKISYVEDESIVNLIKDDKNPLYYILKDEYMSNVMEVIDNLPENYRMVMVYSVYMEFDDYYISKLMNTTEENVRQLRFRARKKIKDKLKHCRGERYD